MLALVVACRVVWSILLQFELEKCHFYVFSDHLRAWASKLSPRWHDCLITIAKVGKLVLHVPLKNAKQQAILGDWPRSMFAASDSVHWVRFRYIPDLVKLSLSWSPRSQRPSPSAYIFAASASRRPALSKSRKKPLAVGGMYMKWTNLHQQLALFDKRMQHISLLLDGPLRIKTSSKSGRFFGEPPRSWNFRIKKPRNGCMLNSQGNLMCRTKVNNWTSNCTLHTHWSYMKSIWSLDIVRPQRTEHIEPIDQQYPSYPLIDWSTHIDILRTQPTASWLPSWPIVLLCPAVRKWCYSHLCVWLVFFGLVWFGCLFVWNTSSVAYCCDNWGLRWIVCESRTVVGQYGCNPVGLCLRVVCTATLQSQNSLWPS